MMVYRTRFAIILATMTRVVSAETTFLSGNLAALPSDQMSLIANDPSAFKTAVSSTALTILKEIQGFSGSEVILPTDHKIGSDKKGNVHVRCSQHMDGHPIEGTSLAVHIGIDGTVFALNGAFYKSPSIELPSTLDCEVALEMALQEYGITNGQWESACEEAAVLGRDGKPHLAFKRLLGFNPEEGPFQHDMVFASRDTGALLNVHHKTFGALYSVTYDCNNGDGSSCDFVSDSPNKISTSDAAANAAHNYLIDTYNFYYDLFGRDSLDDNGMELASFVHYEYKYSNAFYYSGQMVYGDGDGKSYTYFSKALDVVAHELSHGVTDYSSGLIYEDESGALNEAFSDCMGATAERWVLGKSPDLVWTLGEDLDLKTSDGVGFRNMANPPLHGDPDHYDDRYTGSSDNGGVHTNSGIINKWFYLIVEGGYHSGIDVPALDGDFDTSLQAAATIFYNANTQCITAGANFAEARECTLMFADADQVESVTLGWDAVGVGSGGGCTAKGGECSSREECCTDGPELTCDGPSWDTPVCKTCKSYWKSCSRTSQCCSGMKCKKKRCKY